MILNKPIEFGMIDLVLFFFQMVLLGVKMILLSLLKRSIMIFLLLQVYVDDIIFGSTNSALIEKFSSLMGNEFEMSMMGELIFFLDFKLSK
jgi:hypothetical protein